MTTFKNPLFNDQSLLRVFIELSSLPVYGDTKLICLDGVIRHNRLFIMLMFPKIIPRDALGDLVEDDTILLPDFTMAGLHQVVQWAMDTVEKSNQMNVPDVDAKNEPASLTDILCQVKVEDDEQGSGGKRSIQIKDNDLEISQPFTRSAKLVATDLEDSQPFTKSSKLAGTDLDVSEPFTKSSKLAGNDLEISESYTRSAKLVSTDLEINQAFTVDDSAEKPFSISEMLCNLTPEWGVPPHKQTNLHSEDVPDLADNSPLAQPTPGVISHKQKDIKVIKKRHRRKRKADPEDTSVVEDNECYFQAPPGPVLMNREISPGNKKKRKERKRKDPSKPINPYKEKDDMSKPYKPVKMTYKDLPKNLMCTFCPYRTYHISNLTNHMRTHTGEKPYPCSFCGEKFRFSGVRNLHEKTHTGEKEYACQYCGKEFARRYVMILHERTHTGEKPFSCDFCGKRFTRHSTKINHEKSHKIKKDIDTSSRPSSVDVKDKNRISAIILNTTEVEQTPEERSTPATQEKHRSVILATSEAHLYDEKPRVITPHPASSFILHPSSSTPRSDISSNTSSMASPQSSIPHHSGMPTIISHTAASPSSSVISHPVMSPRRSPHPAVSPLQMYEDRILPGKKFEHMEEDNYGRSSQVSPLPPNMLPKSQLSSAHTQALERIQRNSIFPVQTQEFFQNFSQGKPPNHLIP